MSNIITMNNSMFGDVRFLNIEGKSYAVANDVAKVLGYKNPADTIRVHTKGSIKYRYLTNGGNQEVNIIPESDIYRLIIKSKLSKAENTHCKGATLKQGIDTEKIKNVGAL